MKKNTYSNEDYLNLKMIIGLTRSTQRIRKRDADFLRLHHLTLPQFGVLESLYHLGDMRICEIVKKTLSTGGNMTVVINNLIKEDLIRRYKDPEDQRAYIIQLTETGYQLIEEIFPKHLDNVRDAFSHLSIDEKKQLSFLLKKLNRLN